MSMTRSALRTDLQAILGDAAQKFAADAGAFNRHLDMAALALARKTRRTSVVKLQLSAGVDLYPAPDDLVDIKLSNWGSSIRNNRRPWANTLPPAPKISLVDNAGVNSIAFSPAPTAEQISAWGRDYPLFYYSAYAIGDTAEQTTIPAKFRDLILIRATVQALMELADAGIAKPVSLGSQGVGSMPKNGMPAVLAESWLAIFDGGR